MQAGFATARQPKAPDPQLRSTRRGCKSWSMTFRFTLTGFCSKCRVRHALQELFTGYLQTHVHSSGTSYCFLPAMQSTSPKSRMPSPNLPSTHVRWNFKPCICHMKSMPFRALTHGIKCRTTQNERKLPLPVQLLPVLLRSAPSAAKAAGYREVRHTTGSEGPGSIAQGWQRGGNSSRTGASRNY